VVSRNLKNDKNILSKLKFINSQNQWYCTTPNSVSTSTRLCVAYHLTWKTCHKRDKHVTSNIYNFETSPNTKPKEKKWGDMTYYIPIVWKNGGGTSPVSPNKLRPCVDLCLQQHVLRFCFLLQVPQKFLCWTSLPL